MVPVIALALALVSSPFPGVPRLTIVTDRARTTKFIVTTSRSETGLS
jgi:hypothetical protein